MLQQRQLIVQQDAKSPIAEAYRTLRTNIQFAKTDGELKTLMFTSAGPGEGKSTTAANTAIVLAQSGKKVIVIDCDLRRPVQHKIFGRSKRGVTNFLVEDLVVNDLIQDTGIKNLRVFTSGPIPPNPSELLGTAKMRELLDALQAQSDYLILDVPPVVAVTDACVLASKVDGIILVLDSSAVHPPEMAQKAKELLLKAHGRLLGVILNRIEIENEHAYYYYYYGNEKKEKRVAQ